MRSLLVMLYLIFLLTEIIFLGHFCAAMSNGDEEQEYVANKTSKKSNVLPVWGSERTMNLNNLILTNIQGSHYFKGDKPLSQKPSISSLTKFFSFFSVNLYELKTYHEVVDEIYYKVSHLEPWEKGSRKTSGQTGMCGGVSYQTLHN